MKHFNRKHGDGGALRRGEDGALGRVVSRKSAFPDAAMCLRDLPTVLWFRRDLEASKNFYTEVLDLDVHRFSDQCDLHQASDHQNVHRLRRCAKTPQCSRPTFATP